MVLDEKPETMVMNGKPVYLDKEWQKFPDNILFILF